MKIQYMAVIFIIIIVPIVLTLSALLQVQIDTISLQMQYDKSLSDATYDGIQAFQLNTIENDFSTVSDSIRRDIEAAINAFITSLAHNLGVGGYTKQYLVPYIPAIAFTLYDGYYIYSPSLDTETNEYKHILKPYIYYTVRYQKSGIDVTINYTLDNYIIIYGNVAGTYVTKSGYLVVPTDIVLGGINDSVLASISEAEIETRVDNNSISVAYKGVSIEDKSAKKYYVKAKKFTNWVNNNLSNIEAKDAIKENEQPYEEFRKDSNQILRINSSNNPEDENSIFVAHKRDAVRVSIQNNLNAAIARYNESSQSLGTTYDFKMPVLQEDEWTQILSNVNMVTFLQGLPVGTKQYNNYAVIKSTKNKEFIEPNNLYYLDKNVTGENYYHKIDCPHLTEGNLEGHKSIDYSWARRTDPTSVSGAQILNPLFKNNLGCYYCIVKTSYSPITLSEKRQRAFYTTVAKERNEFYKINKYFGQ